MASRRSLGAAAALTPEKMAFIQGAPPEAHKSPKVEKQPIVASDVSSGPLENSAPSAEIMTRPSSRRSRPRRNPPRDFSMEDRENLFPGITNLLVPLTTRLQPTTAAALRRAGLEQKLRGRNPATVQEIAEDAIQAWLRDFGYM